MLWNLSTLDKAISCNTILVFFIMTAHFHFSCVWKTGSQLFGTIRFKWPLMIVYFIVFTHCAEYKNEILNLCLSLHTDELSKQKLGIQIYKCTLFERHNVNEWSMSYLPPSKTGESRSRDRCIKPINILISICLNIFFKQLAIPSLSIFSLLFSKSLKL